MQTLSSEEWALKAQIHDNLVSPYTEAFLRRRGFGKTHAVHDFLFTYYGCSPKKLRQWIPSFEETLIVPADYKVNYKWLGENWFKVEGDKLSLNKDRLQENVIGLAQFTADLCRNILNRPARFKCFGLHEWAMVYKTSETDLRHQGQRLRMSTEELARFVESQSICCSHYDAYRFFTPEAKPMNSLIPVLDTRLELEQAGCLHANMDIYKWATKLWPWIGSDFLAKAFFLALEGRELDMRASPYDLAELGFAPICIETQEGRDLYQQEQRKLTERATPLRAELLALCERFLNHARARS